MKRSKSDEMMEGRNTCVIEADETSDSQSSMPAMRFDSSLHKNAKARRFASVISMLAVTLLAACSDEQKPQQMVPPPAAVTVRKPIQREVADWDEYSGHLQSPETANIQARISGLIEKSLFKEGALVNKGDVLFVIDDRSFKADLDVKQAAVAKDEAHLVLTKAELSRNESLLKQHAVAQQDIDTAKANFEQAQAQVAADKAALEASQLNLEWTHVTAPISGRISRFFVTAGNLVNGGAGQATMLTSIVSVDPVYCYVPMPERDFLKYQTFAAQEKQSSVRDAKIPCFIQLENETNTSHEGFIDFIDNNLDVNTGTIQVRGVFPNPTGSLTPGLFAKMRVTSSMRYHTLLVPDIAVGTEQSEHYILVVGKDDVVASRTVKLGALFGGMRSIVAGLETDDRVIINGLQHAQSGAKVIPTEELISAESLKALDAALAPGAALKSAQTAEEKR